MTPHVRVNPDGSLDTPYGREQSTDEFIRSYVEGVKRVAVEDAIFLVEQARLASGPTSEPVHRCPHCGGLDGRRRSVIGHGECAEAFHEARPRPPVRRTR